ncbi:MAG: glucose-1-phosphate adenylyltransferase, partial [Firmicutes bacterium]|nr:glucose-1-phosphate adenylyltransferase [Bacillota bacterium]
CVLFRGVHICKGVQLKNCIIMQDTRILEDSALSHVICDKDVEIGAGSSLAGSPHLPLVIPKGIKV